MLFVIPLTNKAVCIGANQYLFVSKKKKKKLNPEVPVYFYNFFNVVFADGRTLKWD